MNAFLPSFQTFFSDARHFQILIVSSLIAYLMISSDFAPSWAVLGVSVGASCLFQYLFLSFYRVPHKDLRSALIAGLSIALLLKSQILWVYPIAAFLAVVLKFLVRFKGKHIFNPSNIGIVLCLVLLPNTSWISPGQWGSSALLGLALFSLAFLVLTKSRSANISLFFLGSWITLVFGRAFWLGDPVSIPLHQIQSGALLIFTFFMISDPMTIPNHWIGRLVFAILTAVIAFIFQYEFQIRGAIFYALPLACLLTPLLDRIFKSERYQW